MKKIILLILISTSWLFAQDLNTHYLYQLNWFNINPAFAGEAEGTKIILNPGTQWVGLDDNPTNVMIGAHGQMDPKNSLGGKFVYDQAGIFTTFTTEVLYAYDLKLAKAHNFKFGVSAGVLHTSLNTEALSDGRYTDLSDPNLSSNYYNQTRFMAGLGGLYSFHNFQLGVSLPHMKVSGLDISDHFFGTATYDFQVPAAKLEISPLLVYQNNTNSADLMDLGLNIEWNESFWVQGSYRTNQNMGLGLGVNIKNMSVGYLYNLFSDPQTNFSNGSQQIYLAFTFEAKERPIEPQKLIDKQGNNLIKLNEVLQNLEEVSRSKSIASSSEIESIQQELAELISRLENDTFSKQDEKRIEEIEERIAELRKAEK